MLVYTFYLFICDIALLQGLILSVTAQLFFLFVIAQLPIFGAKADLQ